MAKMLAFIGTIEGEEWCMPVHGETRGKAKSNFWKWSGVQAGFWSTKEDFLFIRLTRFPELDDKPFTPANLEASGWHYTDEDGEPISNDNFIIDCRCSVCKLEVLQRAFGHALERKDAQS